MDRQYEQPMAAVADKRTVYENSTLRPVAPGDSVLDAFYNLAFHEKMDVILKAHTGLCVDIEQRIEKARYSISEHENEISSLKDALSVLQNLGQREMPMLKQSRY